MDAVGRILAKRAARPADVRVAAIAARNAHLQAENRRLRARYDSSQTFPENRKHWAGADGLSANAANNAAVRKTLRERSRYEVGNNSYAWGILQTLANDCVGTGPRLQLNTENDLDNDRVETLFAEWADQVDLAGKLRTMRLAKAQDGEAFALFVTNRRLLGRVKLDLRLIEAERVASPFANTLDQPVDGIILDAAGNPLAYQVLRSHPGDIQIGGSFDADTWPARLVLHYFTTIRPEQARGIPEITSALHLFAQLRRYTLAVIAAAEVAADHAAVIQSDVPPNEEAAASGAAFDTVELEPRMATVLPQGWKLGQMEAVQPTTTFPQFKGEILNEIARPLSMPFNVAACNSSGYNYASGRLDHKTYGKAIRVERSHMERAVLTRTFRAWLSEAVLIEGLLPQSFRRVRSIPHQWFWDGDEHVDPEKEANAQETRLGTGMTTEAEEFGRRGKDWRNERGQRLVERMAELEDKAALLERAKELGLPETVVIEKAPAPAAEKPKKAPAEQEEEPADAA